MLIDSLKNKKKVVTTFNRPQLIVLTQDTLVVTALYKALRDKYELKKETKEIKEHIDVRVWKLFARHVKVKEHEDALKAENKGPGFINVYIGTANRIMALAQMKAIKLESSKLKTIVFDCAPNSKGFSIFETHETREDTFSMLLKSG